MVDHSIRQFLEACQSFETDVILDVGANTGQFAQSVRACGYSGQIISFEPLSEAHAQLMSGAAHDPLWGVVERCAVGAAPGDAQINIAGNSYSSSLLPMLDRHSLAAADSGYQGAETCRVITLDDYIESTFSDPTVAFGLKIDTQGYEARVLMGARRNFSRIKVIVCEMSLVPLYEGAPTPSEVCRLLADAGYRCATISPEFEDPRTGELLQVNGVFVRCIPDVPSAGAPPQGGRTSFATDTHDLSREVYIAAASIAPFCRQLDELTTRLQEQERQLRKGAGQIQEQQLQLDEAAGRIQEQ